MFRQLDLLVCWLVCCALGYAALLGWVFYEVTR